MKKDLDVLKTKFKINKHITLFNTGRIKLWKKWMALTVIIAFLLPAEFHLLAQSNDEIQSQFQRAADSYKKGQKVNALKRLEGIVGIIIEKNMDLKDILGKAYLLMGAIYEKDAVNDLAIANYKRAVEEYNTTLIPGIDFNDLPLYKKYVQPKVIEKQGIKKKKFPWFWVTAGAVLLGVTIYLLIKKSKKYTLAVTMSNGVEGIPAVGTHSYRKGETVPYSFTAQNGFGNLTVLLDGTPTSSSGSINMNKNHTLSVSAEPLGFVVSTSQISVPENSTASFTFRLSARPQNTVSATISNVGDVDDDRDLMLSSGPAFAFTPENWDIPQTVIIYASPDNDTTNGQATFRIRDLGGQIPDATIEATEIDNDSLEFEFDISEVIVPENGDGQFKVRLTASPSAAFTATASWLSGDHNLYIHSPENGQLVFTPANWHEYQTVRLTASHDTDTLSGEAYIRVSAPGIVPNRDIKIIISDDDVLHLVLGTDNLNLNEGETKTIPVKLSASPNTNVAVSISRVSGSSDISFTPQTLTFNNSNWDNFQDVSVSAAQDDDSQNDEAVLRFTSDQLPTQDARVTVEDNDLLGFETNPTTLSVPEQGAATFQVRLTAQPTDTITVTVNRFSGDPDISVSIGQTLTFTASDWSTFQTVTLVAAKDEDRADEVNKNGETIIQITANGVTTASVTATEADNGPGLPPEISIQRPADGETVTDEVIINALATDDFQVKKVEFYINDILAYTVEAYPFRVIWPTLTIPDGTYTIKATAYDWADQSASDTATVTVDDSIPIITDFRTNPNTSPLSGTNVAVNITAKDYKGVQTIRFYVDNVLTSTWNSGPLTEANITISLNTTLYSNGSHTLKAIAIDTTTQESSPSLLNVTINN